MPYRIMIRIPILLEHQGDKPVVLDSTAGMGKLRAATVASDVVLELRDGFGGRCLRWWCSENTAQIM